PWLKNFCASGLDVVIAISTIPCPVMMCAGREGATPPGGGTHMSLSFVFSGGAANNAPERINVAKSFERILFPFELPCDQVPQLPGQKRRPVYTGREPSVARN